MSVMRLKLSTALVLAAVVLAGCTGTPATSNTNSPAGNPAAANVPGFAKFSDIPMPAKNELDLDRTLIFGTDKDWVGRVALAAPMSVNDTYDFYKREMPRLGWTELTSVRSAISVMSYQLDNRVATIQITARRSIIGSSSQIDFWMNPRAGVGASSFGSSGGGYSPPAGNYNPPPSGNVSGGGNSSGGIQSAPLR